MINLKPKSVTRDNIGDIIDRIYNMNPQSSLRIFVVVDPIGEKGEKRFAYSSRNNHGQLSFKEDITNKVITADDLAMLVLKTITEGDLAEYDYTSSRRKWVQRDMLVKRAEERDFEIISVDEYDDEGNLEVTIVYQYIKSMDKLVGRKKYVGDDDYAELDITYEEFLKEIKALSLRYVENTTDITLS